MAEKLSTIEALAAVYKEQGSIAKDKKPTGGMPYSFLSDEMLTGLLHSEFAKVGLIMYPQGSRGDGR